MDKKQSTTVDQAGDTGQVSALSKDIISRRRANTKMVQNVLLIWLDNNINEKDAGYQSTVTQLQHVVNTVKTFIDVDECVDFITDSDGQKAVLIISGTLCQKTVPFIYDIDQLKTIFILCKNKTKYIEWIKHWPKIKGVFTEISSICDILKQTTRQSEHDLISISFMATDGDLANKSLDKLDCSFMYTQILKEILLSIKFEQNHIQKFSDYCRIEVAVTESEIMSINQFEQQYRNKPPIWWYTHECFLYPLVNRALRMMDADIIIMMGFFIADLHRQIEQRHAVQFSGHQVGTTFAVYRGQGMSRTDFAKMTETKGGLLSFNNFLLTSRERDVSVLFAESIQSNGDLFGILFVMTIDSSQSTAPFSSISGVSRYQGEDEVLFSMHTVFRIRDIKSMDESNRLFQVDLTLTSDNDEGLCAITERIRKETEEFTGWYRLGQLLLDMGQSEKAQQVFEVMLEQTADEREKWRIYDRLGMTKYKQGEYQEAITFYEKALGMMRKTLPSNHFDLATSYNNIGLVYVYMGHNSNALSSYDKALSIWEQSLPPNHPSLASSCNNIGMVYHSMREYSKALLYYEKSLAIKQRSLPPNHPNLALFYGNVGSVYGSMGEYSKALSCYEKALAVQQRSLPPNHPDLAMSYNNIGATYATMGDYSKARSFYERAVDNGQRSLPPNHPHLQKCRNNLNKIKKKL